MTGTKSKPLIALTMGDPAGIGPELCLAVAAHHDARAVCRPVIVGDASVLRMVGERLGLALPPQTLTAAEGESRAALDGVESAALIDLAILSEPVEPGRPARAAGLATYKYILYAIRGALAHRFAAVTTAPLTKSTLHLAGIPEKGHTEIFARETDCDNYAMMMYSDRLAVGLVTIHQPLATVPGSLRASEIRRVAMLTHQTLHSIRGREPRLAILGLNPHGGEDGLFGREDIEIILPAVEQLRREGYDVEGPLPPDAAFMPHALERYGGHVVMYHDQGLIPFKMVSLHDGVNVTMGLPIVRTSPDHGTAYDIAWQGKANPSSMLAAVKLAARMAG
jgi:4-hydroxythreonine-4-phosphate dehydrogenase